MGLAVLIIGESGAGKSASLRNFKKGEIGVFSLHKTRLPFRTDIKPVCMSNMAYSERYDVIKSAMMKNQKEIKTFVIDDSDYLMFFEQQQRSNEGGYGKFTEIASHLIELNKFIQMLDDDVIVYFLNHVEKDDTGKKKAITAGKMIDNQLGTFEALFEIAILCDVRDGEHVFITNTDGSSTAKTPIGMFEDEIIDNDLKLVDKTIREYFGM